MLLRRSAESAGPWGSLIHQRTRVGFRFDQELLRGIAAAASRRALLTIPLVALLSFGGALAAVPLADQLRNQRRGLARATAIDRAIRRRTRVLARNRVGERLGICVVVVKPRARAVAVQPVAYVEALL